MAKVGETSRSWLDRIPYALFVGGAGLSACLAMIYFFCPRYYVWRGVDLGIPELYSFPELNRAMVVLGQLEDPFVKIDHPSNNVVAWRLLFPIVGHYLHLGRHVFLALPFIGCWATASLIVHVMTGATASRAQAFFAAIVACGAAWFFVSTAWLAYNDSWVVLALTTVACVRSRVALAAACLLVPWIDERFLLVLPTALAMRTFFFPPRERWLREFVVDVAAATAASAPYLLIRLVSYLNGTDPVTAAYLAEQGGAIYPWTRYVEGSWAGLRANWIYIAIWIWLAAGSRPIWWTTTAVLGTIASFIVAINSAGDIHRSAGVFVIIALAGMALLQRRSAEFNAKLLPIAALLSIALPASHVITVFKIPIYGAFDEWNHAEQNAIPFLNPQYYGNIGVQLLQANKADEAMPYFDRALKLDPTNAQARVHKALILANKDRVDEAIAELNTTLGGKSDIPEAFFLRGQLREKQKDYRGAVGDYERAAKAAPKGTDLQKQAESQFKRLRGLGISPTY